MVSPDAAERFQAAPLLSEVARASRRAVLEALDESRAAAGTVLLAQGEPNDRLSFLIDGTVSVARNHPDGRREPFTALAAPAVFGVTSFFLPGPSIVTVEATTDAWLLTLTRPALDRLRESDPRAAEALALAAVRVLSERFDMLVRRVSDFTAKHPDDRPRASEWSRFRTRLFEEANP